MHITLDIVEKPVEQKPSTKKQTKKLNQEILNKIKQTTKHPKQNHAHQKLM